MNSLFYSKQLLFCGTTGITCSLKVTPADFLIAVPHNSSMTLKSFESPALKGQTEHSEMSSYQHCANQVTDLRVAACPHCFILIISIPNSAQYPFLTVEKQEI